MSKILINSDGVTDITPEEYAELANVFLAGKYIQIDLGSQAGLGETITAGTLTFRAKAPGGYAYSAITPDDAIDCSAPAPLVIGINAIGEIECTASGVDATGDKIQLQIVAMD